MTLSIFENLVAGGQTARCARPNVVAAVLDPMNHLSGLFAVLAESKANRRWPGLNLHCFCPRPGIRSHVSAHQPHVVASVGCDKYLEQICSLRLNLVKRGET